MSDYLHQEQDDYCPYCETGDTDRSLCNCGKVESEDEENKTIFGLLKKGTLFRRMGGNEKYIKLYTDCALQLSPKVRVEHSRVYFGLFDTVSKISSQGSQPNAVPAQHSGAGDLGGRVA